MLRKHWFAGWRDRFEITQELRVCSSISIIHLGFLKHQQRRYISFHILYCVKCKTLYLSVKDDRLVTCPCDSGKLLNKLLKYCSLPGDIVLNVCHDYYRNFQEMTKEDLVDWIFRRDAE